MSHRLYLYNKAEIGSVVDACLPLMEWSNELPLLLQPLFDYQPQVAANCYNAPGSKEGLYAEAADGIEALRRFYDFIERHAAALLDDVEAFHQARERIFQLLDTRASHAWVHLDAWDLFNISDETHAEQAKALLAEIKQTNACIHEAIASDNPLLLDACLGAETRWSDSFRGLLNTASYDYGWAPLSSLQPGVDEEEPEIFCENELYGLRDATGKLLIAPRYQEFFDFSWDSGLACVLLNERYGYVDRHGREVITCQFEDAFDFTGDHALVTEGGKFGLIDLQGRLRVPCQFDGGEPLDYRGAHWCVQQGELWGVIDPRGQWMLPVQYRQFHAYEGYYTAVREDGTEHVFTSAFHDLGPIDLDDISSVSVGETEVYVIRRRVDRKSLYRTVDEQGQTLLPGEYQALKYLYEMQAWLVRDGRKYGLYRHDQQRWLLPCEYARIELQQYGCREDDGGHYCRVQQGRRWGLYRSGSQPGWSIEPRFEQLDHLDQRLFNACLNGRWGIIDCLGQWLRQPQDDARADHRFRQGDALAVIFHDGRAWALREGDDCQPLTAERALDIIERYSQFGLDDTQLACLRVSAGDLWQAQDAHQRGLIAYEEKDYQTARPLLQRAAELGNAEAINDLACLLQDADQDDIGAFACFQRASAAGSALAARNVASNYRYGRGTEVDLQQARAFYQLATERGHRPAHLELARLLIDLDDLDPALEHYLAAWRHGDKDKSASFLGWLYEQRDDFAQAQRYYLHAIRQNDGYAHWRLGRIHLYGQGHAVNFDKAGEHLRIACEQEQEGAYLDMAELLLGDEASQAQGLEWLHKALELGVDGARERAEELLDARPKSGLLQRLRERLR